MDETIQGRATPTSAGSQYNLLHFIVQQLLGRIHTNILVQVKSCTNNGALAGFGFVDVVPLVNQVDGQGKPIAHTTVFNLPYLRLQGGTNAIIIDPQPGDIGMAAICERDISSVKATQAQANPGSWARFALADGIYFGGMLNKVPEQYIQFSGDGIKLYSPVRVTVQAPDVKVVCETAEVNASTSLAITTPSMTVN